MKDKKQNINTVCYIVGAGDLQETSFSLSKRGILIAADGGYTAIKKAGIIPDYLVGDLDSLVEIPNDIPTEIHCKEKDETDMMLAVNKGFDLGYRKFVIYGGLGGRLEHSIANIQLLSYIAKKKARGYLIQGDNIITVLIDENYTIKAKDKGYISVFSLCALSKGVTLKGLKYILNDSELTNDCPIGISNEFIGKSVSIDVKDGTLMVLWSSKDPEESLFT